MSARVLEHRQDEGWVHSSAAPSHAVPLAALTVRSQDSTCRFAAPTALFEGSQASPACPSDLMLLR